MASRFDILEVVPRRARSLLALLALLAAVVVAVVAYGPGSGASDGSASGDRTGAEVVRVVDGDTVVVRVGSVEEHVRLIGIDTPETVDPRSPVECFGKEASRRTGELLPVGTPVRVVRDVEARDRYQRLLAYLYRAEDDTFVNLALVEEGYASVLTYPPNVAHTDAFVVAAAEAREAGRGLWSACGGPDEPP